MIDSYLFDKLRNQYAVSIDKSDSSFDALIIWKRTVIGRIQSVFIPSRVLVLGNIEIFDDPIMPRNGLFSRHPFRRPHMNFRQRGLGSAMLEFLIAEAEELGAVGISGFITPDDARKTPYLFDFYRHHGFTVTMVPGRSPDGEARIYKEIRPRASI